MLTFLIVAGVLFAIHVVLTALPPGTRLVRVLQNAWQAFWGLLFLSTAIGILFFLCGLGMLIAGLLTGNLWLMLLGFIIVEAVAIGFSAGLSVVGLGSQAHTAMLAGAVVLITAAIIRFGLLVGQNLIAPAIAGPVVGSILVVSILLWILSAFILRGDPRKYARACANVAIWWWVVFAILAVYRGSDFLQSVVDRWVGAPSEVQTVENKLGAAILRHQNRLSEEKIRHILGSNVSPVYIDLEGFNKKVLYGYDDSGRLIGETVSHGEQVNWYEQRPISNAVQTVLEGTNAVYIRKKDLNGMPTTAGVGMWIPFEKRREGEKIFSFIVSEKPNPLPAPANPGGGGGLGGQTGTRPSGQGNLVSPTGFHFSGAPHPPGTNYIDQGEWGILVEQVKVTDGEEVKITLTPSVTGEWGVSDDAGHIVSGPFRRFDVWKPVQAGYPYIKLTSTANVKIDFAVEVK